MIIYRQKMYGAFPTSWGKEIIAKAKKGKLGPYERECLRTYRYGLGCDSSNGVNKFINSRGIKPNIYSDSGSLQKRAKEVLEESNYFKQRRDEIYEPRKIDYFIENGGRGEDEVKSMLKEAAATTERGRKLLAEQKQRRIDALNKEVENKKSSNILSGWFGRN